jgi:hypothetical protein
VPIVENPDSRSKDRGESVEESTELLVYNIQKKKISLIIALYIAPYA